LVHPPSVRIVEVGPRDGLQNEATVVPAALRARFIENLATAGLRSIEAGSFVSPHAVPSMADSGEVLRSIRRAPGVTYTALVPNLKGLEAALCAGAMEVAVFASASETFSQRNIQCSIAHSLGRYREVCLAAAGASVRVRGYISCVAGCPFEGPVAASAVGKVAEELLGMGCYEISLGDTIGIGTAGRLEILLHELLAQIPARKIAVHFHDTWGQALANILMALQMGISVVDSSAAGLGGCPYAPGATGNVATEDVLYMLHGLGIESGVDLDLVAQAGREMCEFLNRRPASKASLAISARNRP
jgi:hydroxymethylglutaryl-CoA lyase